MTVGNYIAGVRTKLADIVQVCRFSPAEVSESLTVALKRAKQVRPSLRFANMVPINAADDVDFAGSVSATVREELDPYFEALVLLAAARMLANDNSDTMNGSVAEKWKGQGLELLEI